MGTKYKLSTLDSFLCFSPLITFWNLKMLFMCLWWERILFLLFLDQTKYSCHFLNGILKLFYDDLVIRTDTLCGGLYKIDLDLVFENSIKIVIAKKRNRIDEKSSML